MKTSLDGFSAPPLDRRFDIVPLRRRKPASIAAIALCCAGLVACANEDKQDELEAILKDGDLTSLTRRALSETSPGMGTGGAVSPVGGSGGTAAGTGGAAGAGSAGSTGGPDAGTGSGTGGVIGTDAGVGTGGRGMGGFGGGFPLPDGGGMGGSGVPFPQGAQGLWQFEDCNPERTELSDSSFNGHTAFRSVSAACTSGIVGQGIAIDGAEDLVYVPDQPNFTFDNGVTVAAWVEPHRLGGVRTIFRKRESGTSTFVLLSNDRDYQFVIRLDNGRAASVRARATVDTFTHVAGTYDGQELRLYLDGVLAAQTRVAGRLSSGAGPLLMGNDALGRRTDGRLDNVFFDLSAATPEQIVRLTCQPRPSTLVAVPASSPLVAPGTEVSYDVQLTNNGCDVGFFQFNAFSQSPDLFVQPSFDVRQVEPGTTAHIALSVTSSPNIEPDDFVVSLNAFNFGNGFESIFGSLTYSVAGTPCSIRSRRELSIRDVSVVDDPVRTGPGGAWTFGRLMENMARTPEEAPAMVEAMLSTWLTDQTVNGFTVAALPGMQDLILTPFPRTPGGELDLSRAPFRLLAIVNRIDLHDSANGSAGEGRFVFGVLNQFGDPLSFTMIVEYNIPAASAQNVTDLANAWHALSSLPFPSEQYNAALQAVTERFTNRNAAPGRVNGSALGQLRANDFFSLGGVWEFRELHLSPATGQLELAPVALTPDRSLNNTTILADYINANEASILIEKHSVPATFAGQPFIGGSMITDFFVWDAPGVNPQARAKFALNTCNGCHTSSLETNTPVFQISPRSVGQESSLSPFLLGTQVFDPFANVIRVFNELGRRGRIMHTLVCPDEPLPPAPPETIPVGGTGGIGGGRGDGGIGGRMGTGGFIGTGGFMGSGGFVGSGGNAGGASDGGAGGMGGGS
jgi:hypothetical protein